MKALLRTLFSPLLNLFETEEDNLVYKPSHRTVLIIVGCLFAFLSIAVFTVGFNGEGLGFLLPGCIFGAAATVSLVVGCLGTDKAVAKLWGSR